MESSNILIIINASTLGVIIIFGYKILRFINRIEFKTDILWRDYEYRISGKERRHS